jgi:uncharacterized membrane protein
VSAALIADGVALLFAIAAFVWQSCRALSDSAPPTAHHRHRIARKAWLETTAGGTRDVLAVQTLRNWIMSVTFLASTSILFALGLLAAAFTNDKLSTFAQGINLFGNDSGELWLFKALLLVTVFLVAFFAFSLSIRAFVHLGFMINVPIPAEDKEAQARILAREMEKGAFNYWLGLRCYYAAALLTFWLFGPVWMAIGTVVLLIALRRID